MDPQVTVVGSTDQRLLELLAACGLRVSNVPESEVAPGRSGAAAADVVIIDMRGQPRVPPALAALRQRMPRTRFVVVASRLDSTLLLEAMRAGASECLVEPLTAPEVQAAIGRVLMDRAGSNGGVFAFLGAKGGVGTTTTAVNVATELSRAAPGATLVVDLHLACGDAAVFLGAEPRFSVKDALQNIDRLDEAFFRSLVVRTRSGVDLLASPDRMAAIPVDVAQIRQVVDIAARYYQFTVVDVPRSEPAVLEGLDGAKAIVVVANQELATVRSAARIATMLRQRYGQDRVRIVVSRFDPRADILEADVRRAVGGAVECVLPSDYRAAVDAMNTGQPLVLGNHTTLSASFSTLARGLAGLELPDHSSQARRGLFGRLTNRRTS